MFNRRTKHLIILYIALSSILIYALTDRMLINRKEFFNARYTDTQFIELIENLITDNVLRVNNGKVEIDETLLAGKNFNKSEEKRIRRSLPFLSLRDNTIHFDKLSVSIVNNRTFFEDRVVRGRFLDRNGVVLAESIVNDRVWKQKRHYPFGPEFYPVIGHWSPVFGKRNLEKAMDDYLMGRNHWPVYRESVDLFRKVKVGDDVVLTIDSKVHSRAYSLMKGKKGAVVMLNVKTGEVLAAVSTPSFDPNTKEREQWRKAFKNDSDRPYKNRAISALYPPGSTFKTIVASAWLEVDLEDIIKKDYHVLCDGRKNKYNISDIHVHGNVDFDKAFAMSCNIFFSEIGVLLGHNINDYAERFGFNSSIDLIPQMKDLKYVPEKSLAFSWYTYSSGNAELKAYKEIDFRQNPKIVAQVSIGQNLVTATPLQMAMIAATIANRGVMLNPFIVKEIKKGNGNNIFSSNPVKKGRIIKKSTARKLRKMMVKVMERGTGKDVRKIYYEGKKYKTKLRDPGCLKRRTGLLKLKKDCRVVEVAGKTGTAEVGDRNRNGRIDRDERPHSWFIGFAPADDPEVAIAVIAENQGYGSLTAAPIAVEVIAEALNLVKD